MAGGRNVVSGSDAEYADTVAIFEGVSGFGDATSPVLVRNAQEALAYATAGLAGWARGSPLAEKWDEAAEDAMEDLVVAAVKREQQKQSAQKAVLFAKRVFTVLED